MASKVYGDFVEACNSKAKEILLKTAEIIAIQKRIGLNPSKNGDVSSADTILDRFSNVAGKSLDDIQISRQDIITVAPFVHEAVLINLEGLENLQKAKASLLRLLGDKQHNHKHTKQSSPLVFWKR
jgi:hypothetical protein